MSHWACAGLANPNRTTTWFEPLGLTNSKSKALCLGEPKHYLVTRGEAIYICTSCTNAGGERNETFMLLNLNALRRKFVTTADSRRLNVCKVLRLCGGRISDGTKVIQRFTNSILVPAVSRKSHGARPCTTHSRTPTRQDRNCSRTLSRMFPCLPANREGFLFADKDSNPVSV